MILVDTSVWIELLAGRMKPVSEDAMSSLATCPPVIQEVLQGLRAEMDVELFRDRFLAFPIVANPVPLEFYLAAADIFRHGRRRGITVRSGVDCLIAAIAIENGLRVWHRDRDFDAIARYTALETV